MFNEKDIQQIKSKGIDLPVIEKQLKYFREGFPYVHLIAPATTSNGIMAFEEETIDELNKIFEKASVDKNIIKFVPASGAASRMFKHLHAFRQKYRKTGESFQDFLKDQSFNSVYNFIVNIRNFAFYDDLEQLMKNDGSDIEKCLKERDYNTLIEYVLDEKGLNYSNTPKGLIKFHDYDDGPRMAFEEHLVESAEYCRNKDGKVSLHFTVSPEHLENFREAVDEKRSKYRKKLNVEFDVSFSVQKPSTDTIAVDMNNEPFREADGSLFFRPGGHGALIENLNDLQADLVFIKNIDNVVPDKFREPTYLYKKALGGYLLKLQEETFAHLRNLEDQSVDLEKVEDAADFATNELNIDIVKTYKDFNKEQRRQFIFEKLNRPIRVCGMVKNEGEPGGGPFWIKNNKGEVVLQIVEKSQVDPEDSLQNAILRSSTHFNPVDLVCSIRNYKGDAFDLKQYIDPTTGFISTKSKDGKSLKAQELPGLWNGAMAEWITVFVETPIITFNPVKTINDLLRDTHQ